MVCIYCGSVTQVGNSRLQKRVNSVWRRRACTSCKAIFTTIEQADLSSTLIVKHNERLMEPFERDKLFVCIYESCRHRANALTDATSLVLTATSEILKTSEGGVIHRYEITRIVHRMLCNFDAAAANVYAAYHPIKKTTD